MNTTNLRKVVKVFTPPVVPEGRGAKVTRIIGTNHLKDLNPFIMLDYFCSRLPAGFPDHPHRGFETVTYMMGGSSFHEDSRGNSGQLKAGDLQWMTAGKGIIHAEIPGSYDEDSEGFQLWINLQKKFKLCEPQYQEITKEKIPVVSQDGVQVKLIAGEAFGQKGPIYARTPAFYLDVTIEAQKAYEQKIPLGFNGLCHVYRGEGIFGSNQLVAKANQTVVLDINDKNETLQIKTTDGVSFILIAGEPINEPIVQYGPFVMNSKEEIEQTLLEYQQGINGFEGAHTWESKIRKMCLAKK